MAFRDRLRGPDAGPDGELLWEALAVLSAAVGPMSIGDLSMLLEVPSRRLHTAIGPMRDDLGGNRLVLTGPDRNAVAEELGGHLAYIANSGSNSVSVIDSVTNTVINTIKVGVRPMNVAVSPDGRHAYITNSGSDSVSVIDTVTNAVINTINVGAEPWDLAISPNGRRAYTANGSGSVSAIDVE